MGGSLRVGRGVGLARWGVVLVLLAPGGCRTVPDVGAFGEASEALHVVVASVGADVGRELRTRADGKGQDAAKWNELHEQFEEAWAARTAAMGAVADYAAGLVAVVEAGNSGEANAREVIDKAGVLITTFKAAYPAGAPAVDLLNEAIVKGYGAFARDRAARSVAEAIEYVGPAVSDLASILAEDFATLERLVEDHRIGELAALDAEYQLSDERPLAVLNSIGDARAGARAAAFDAAADADELREKLAAAEAWNRLYEQELAAPWHVEMTARRAAIKAKHDARRDLIRTASATVRAWGDAHDKLARAAKTKQSPSFAVLVRLTAELLDTYEEVRRHD